MLRSSENEISSLSQSLLALPITASRGRSIRCNQYIWLAFSYQHAANYNINLASEKQLQELVIRPSIMETRTLEFSSSIRLRARGTSSIRLIGVAPITSVPPSPSFANSISRYALSRTDQLLLHGAKAVCQKCSIGPQICRDRELGA